MQHDKTSAKLQGRVCSVLARRCLRWDRLPSARPLRRTITHLLVPNTHGDEVQMSNGSWALEKLLFLMQDSKDALSSGRGKDGKASLFALLLADGGAANSNRNAAGHHHRQTWTRPPPLLVSLRRGWSNAGEVMAETSGRRRSRQKTRLNHGDVGDERQRRQRGILRNEGEICASIKMPFQRSLDSSFQAGSDWMSSSLCWTGFSSNQTRSE